MAVHNDFGRWGEEQAAEYLHKKSYIIRERDWKFGKCDIDIIALGPDGTEVVFVEVKTRTDDNVAQPEQAIDTRKIRNIGAAANAYVKMHEVQEELRFDVVTIVGSTKENMRVEHIKDAFNPLLLFK